MCVSICALHPLQIERIVVFAYFMSATLPEPSSEQLEALRAWRSGVNQVCVATAGAGKSTLLLHACAASDEPVLIVTYNKALQCEMDSKLDAPHCCFTFHGLASSYFCVAADDEALHAILDNGVEMRREPAYSRVCIDEAQDLKDVYVKLLQTMFDVRKVQWLIVGDPSQLLNDFDADDPARISFMQDPAVSFGADRPWSRTRLGTSRRLTGPVVRVANAMLDASIPPVIAGGKRDPVPVHICTMDPFNCSEVVVTWISVVRRIVPGASVMVLVARRRGNSAISTLVNTMSRCGIGVYVHGHDCESSAHPSKVTIVSWHSAKGLQCDASVVLGVEESSAHNPLHVALTRSQQHMLIVNSIRRPNRRLIESICDDAELVRLDGATRVLVRDGITPKPEVENVPMGVRDLSLWNLTGRGRVSSRYISPCHVPVTLCGPSSIAGEVSVSAITTVDSSRIYLRAVLLKYEYVETGSCRVINFMLSPVSPSSVDRKTFFENPSHAYLLSPGERESNLLPPYAYTLLRDIIDRGPRSVVDWVNIAVVAEGFCGYHHTMGALLPCDSWVDDAVFLNAFECLRVHMASMEKPVTFDTRWSCVVDGTTLHKRCFATTAAATVTVMYGEALTNGDRARACLVASLHPTVTRAVLLNLKIGTRHVFLVRDKMTLLRSLVSI